MRKEGIVGNERSLRSQFYLKSGVFGLDAPRVFLTQLEIMVRRWD